MEEYFDITGISPENGNRIYKYIRNNEKICDAWKNDLSTPPLEDFYWGCCDDDSPSCPSWASFKSGFENPTGLSLPRQLYGSQCGHTAYHAEDITARGHRWMFALEANPRKIDDSLRDNTLQGRWIPSSSGGQASFSMAMHW